MAEAASASAGPTTRAASSAAGPVPRQPWARGAAAIALTLFAWSTAVAGEPPPGMPTDAATLLERIQQAAQRQTYAGVFVHQQGSQVQSSRITHLSDRTGEHEKLELMDGQAREFIRHNDDVRCYLSGSRVILIEKRARHDSFPALLTSAPVDIDQYYKLTFEGQDRIAGRLAQLIVLEARDQRRYGYRFWFDKASFLLLKAQTINEKGVSIEQVAFTNVVVGGPVDAASIRPDATDVDGWRTETNRMEPTDLAQAGWSVSQPVAGFRKMMEVRRALGGRGDVGQMVYSDGLAAISIFIERTAPAEGVEGEASKGPVNVVTERHGDFWLTIVGDAPASSVRDMAKQVAYRKAK